MTYVPIQLFAVETEVQLNEEQIQFFEKRIRPVLVEHCYQCHSAASAELAAKFMLDSREGMLTGGELGKAIVPGEPAKSLLLSAIKYEELEMPPDNKLSEHVIADFTKWIEMGAPDPRTNPTAPLAQKKSEIDWEVARKFWSFQPVQSPRLPLVEDQDWPANRIDFFVLSKIETAQIQKAEPADRRTLIRRLSFDLTGLPPDASEVQQFLADGSQLAYENLVERLLASPRHGEHRARMWLDLARYAEDQAHIVGNDQSLFYPNAYLYRDWVISALNADLPYDDFVRLQLAADLIATDESESVKDHQNDTVAESQLVALGFIGLGPKYYRRNDPQVMADEWEDRIDVTARTFLGLTVACARCHDHKFDPITTEDFYALAGIFASTEMHNRALDNDVKENEQETTQQEKTKKEKGPAAAMHIVRDNKPRDVNVYVRGDASTKGDLVPRRFLTVLNSATAGNDVSSRFSQGSGRGELAEAIVDRQNPLTARVIVNRIWGQMLGKPLVATPSNFGSRGQPPTHPELLDDLAFRFMQNNWSLKWLQREIALSSTYRLSSSTSQRQAGIDPENQLLARANRKRLSVEQWRDALLVAGDQLEFETGGKSALPAEPDAHRRTVYSKVSRYELDHLLAMFDFPDPNNHASRRNETTTPLQKMFVLNSPFMVAQADRIVARIRRDIQEDQDASVDAPRFIDQAYWQLFGRAPTDQELRIGTEYVNQRKGVGTQADSLQQYMQALIASNEFFYLD